MPDQLPEALVALRERTREAARQAARDWTAASLQGLDDVQRKARTDAVRALSRSAGLYGLTQAPDTSALALLVARETLALDNVEVVQSRAEAYRPQERFDTVIARAVGPLVDLVRNGGGLVAGGGRLLAMKGRFPEDELARKLSGWKVVAVHPLHVPGLGEERHLVELAHSHEKT